MKLGCIGDDFTGSSDLANTLAKGGMRVVQYSGIPDGAAEAEVEAGVVALKSRSIDPNKAVSQSLEALEWLKAQGCTQFFFKYCSTFDSTPKGNIGPVADALADALGAHKIIVCPAFPGTGRSIYQGHLFVGNVPLNESGMENHPITPMTDADIRRILQAQSEFHVGHVGTSAVFEGSDAISRALEDQHRAGKRHIVVDAIRDQDLFEIGKAAKDLPLITGGSGVALGLPANFGCEAGRVPWESQDGKCVILSGSCSNATRAQVAAHQSAHSTREIDPADVIEGQLTTEEISNWLLETEGLPLIYSSAEPEKVEKVQRAFGLEKSSEVLEAFFGEVARLCAEGGATRIISAGGETSGAVVNGIGINALQIGPEIDPGVPALRANPNLVVALKSGNFGAPNFFEKAAQVLAGTR